MTEYLTVDYDMGHPPESLTDSFNVYGAQGWLVSDVQQIASNKRRVVFTQTGSAVEYLVINYDVGKSSDAVTVDLNSYGADGWVMNSVYMIRQNLRRIIFTKDNGGQSGGGIAEAPLDDKTYGRMNATWNLAIAHDNDVVDGGSF
jgi:hypothetical protein